MTDVLEGEVVEESNLPAVRASEAIIARDEITVDQLLAQAGKVKEVMRRAMVPEVHYGHIPGVKKPTLLKPGAETLLVLLRLAPFYQSERTFHDDGHLTVVSKVTLRHIPTGLVVSEGEGLCTSREKKYAVRTAGRKCPKCGAEAIIKGKAEYGGGWVCFKKKDGCGAKFGDADPAIVSQETGTVDNPELPDTFNTVLKMANKRALIAAVLNGTAASDIFTQDIEADPVVEDDGKFPPADDVVLDPELVAAGAAVAARAAGGESATLAEPDQTREAENADGSASARSAAVVASDARSGDAVKSTVSSSGSASAVISEPQRRRLRAIQKSAGVTDDALKAMVDAIAGVTSSKDIPRDKYDELVTAVEAAGEKSGFQIPEGART